MSTLVAIAYPDHVTAESAKLEVMKAQEEFLVEVEDIVIAERRAKGKVRLHQATNLTALGAAGGTFWGTLVGMIFMTPIFGAAVGATSGAVSGALTDAGINNDVMKDIAKDLEEGTSTLFVLVHKVTADKVVERLQPFGGTVVTTNLNHADEERLQAALKGEAPVEPAV